MSFSFHVTGQADAAWLAAAALLRFGPPGCTVTVEAAPPETGVLILRPEAARLHQALGLTPQALRAAGARATAAWPAGETAVPFAPHGPPLSGVPFHQLWAQAAARGDPRPLSAFGVEGAAAPAAPAAAIASGRYAQLLEALARRVGAQPGPAAGEAMRVVTDGEAAGPRAVAVGRAALPVPPGGGLDVTVLHRTLLALTAAMPLGAPGGAEWREARRRVAAPRPVLEDLCALIGGAPGSDRLGHQRAVWRSTGRLCPWDDDPLRPHEWAALLAAHEGAPRGGPLLAARLPAEALTAHLGRFDKGAREALHG